MKRSHEPSTGENKVFAQYWLEVEPGYERPDGFSLHVSLEGLKQYIDKVFRRDASSPYFDFPLGDSFVIGVDNETYKEIVGRGGSGRYYNSELPRQE